MKRLILMGGRPWLAKDSGKEFVQVLFRYYPNEVKLAFCIFAQPENEWDETRKINIEMFKKFAGDRNVAYQTITPENLIEVSQWADIIYLPGGSSFGLLEKIKPFNVAKLWDGKLVAGASAGAVLFTAGFVSLSSRKFGHGLGWISVSCIPHWRSEDFEGFTQADWDWAEQENLRQLPDMPVLCLPESEFVEFTVK